MSGHTKGPWMVEHTATAGLRIVYGEANEAGFRSDVPQGRGKLDPSEEERANARLMAAAPDLLKAGTLAEAILAECFGADPDKVAEQHPAIAGVLRLLRPAIAKAVGQ